MPSLRNPLLPPPMSSTNLANPNNNNMSTTTISSGIPHPLMTQKPLSQNNSIINTNNSNSNNNTPTNIINQTTANSSSSSSHQNPILTATSNQQQQQQHTNQNTLLTTSLPSLTPNISNSTSSSSAFPNPPLLNSNSNSLINNNNNNNNNLGNITNNNNAVNNNNGGNNNNTNNQNQSQTQSQSQPQNQSQSQPQNQNQNTNPPPPQQEDSVRHAVKFENALEFLDQVKNQFQNQNQTYTQFLDVMKDFKLHKIDTPGVIIKVSELFKGHNNLIEGFNTFLPLGYKITVPVEQTNHKQPEFDHARGYVKKIKSRFADQPETYKQFLEILHAFHREQHTIKEVYGQVAQLFKDHSDLLDEFTQFLPDPVPSKNSGNVGGAHLNQAGGTSGGNAAANQAGGAPTKKKKEKTGGAAVTGEKKARGSRKSANQPSSAHPFSGKGTAGEGGNKASQSTPSTGNTNSGSLNTGELDIKPGGVGAKGGAVGGSMIEEDSFKQINFFYKIKKKLHNVKLYNDFLKCLHLFTLQIITRGELIMLVKDILEPHKQEWERFKALMGYYDGDMPDEYDFGANASESEMESDDNTVNGSHTTESSAMGSGGNSHYNEGGGSGGVSGSNVNGRESSSSTVVREEKTKDVSEIDLGVCKRFGPSYRELPKNVNRGVSNKLPGDLSGVLNEKYVSSPTGTEDFGGTGSRKNHSEELLFKCEDDRYELDLVIEQNSSTIKVLEPVLKRLQELPEEESKKHKWEGELSVLNVRAIERVYGSKGPDVVEGILNNPIAAIPLVLKRLKQKDYEWRKARREWNKIWREVAEKNYQRSLDHQGIYFKQSEKKILNPKVLMAEIKKEGVGKRRDGRRREEEREIDLKWDMGRRELMRDINSLITNAAEKVNMNKNDREKLDVFLEHFVSEFFFLKDDSSDSNANGTNKDNNDNNNKAEEKMEVDEGEGSSNSKKIESIVEPIQRGNSGGGGGGGVKSTSNNAVGSNGKIGRRSQFYGSVTFYTFFRFYQIMYLRLAKISVLEQDAQQTKWLPSLLASSTASISPSSASNYTSTSYSDSMKEDPNSNNNNNNNNINEIKNKEDKDKENKEKDKEEGTSSKYNWLITSVYGLLEGSLDINKFEDDVRDKFGIGGFILFTLDKLIITLAKQLQVLISDEVCVKLVALYKYEQSKTVSEKDNSNNTTTNTNNSTSTSTSTSSVNSGSVNSGGINEENSFRANVMGLLGDEKCFNFEYNETNGEFGIGMVEGKRDGRRFVDLSWNKEKWSEYVESWVRSEVSDIDVVRNMVFLVRNKKKNLMKERIEQCTIQNNLECKICLSTYRLFYVEETEDFMSCKKVQKSKESQNNKMEEDNNTKPSEEEEEEPRGGGVGGGGEKMRKREERYREWLKNRLEKIDKDFPSGTTSKSSE